MKILVTGAAGFIGYHLVHYLLGAGHSVVGVDSLNNRYDVRLKQARLMALGVGESGEHPKQESCAMRGSFRFRKFLLEDREALGDLFVAECFDLVIHLAAQAGVRHSLQDPYSYIDSNISGFVNLLECCHRHPVRHLLYASSSSVYGGNVKVPFSEDDAVDSPVSLYAATKRCDELLATLYARLYGIPMTGLRFFTVYGPWGRPDMAPMLFTKAMLSGEPIQVFNYGEMERDFTYVEDIIEAIARLLEKIPSGNIPAEIYNIGSGHPILLMDFIRTLEQALGRKAKLNLQPMQPGDVPRTWADTTKLQQAIGFSPRTSLQEGVARFVAWYLSNDNPLQ